MKNISNIHGILLDYGGTVDTDGIHWAEVLWEEYVRAGVPTKKSDFREAYRHGERTLALNPIILPTHTFRDVLTAKIEIQLKFLAESGKLPAAFDIPNGIENIANACYRRVRHTTKAAVPTLKALSQKYPIILVSNFYGNIKTVLQDLDIDAYFDNIVESASAGVRKPDPAIFELGVRLLRCKPHHTIAVGDSYTKDIIPAKQTGCRTVWLKGAEWEETTEVPDKADYIIKSFKELETIC